MPILILVVATSRQAVLVAASSWGLRPFTAGLSLGLVLASGTPVQFGVSTVTGRRVGRALEAGRPEIEGGSNRSLGDAKAAFSRG